MQVSLQACLFELSVLTVSIVKLDYQFALHDIYSFTDLDQYDSFEIRYLIKMSHKYRIGEIIYYNLVFSSHLRDFYVYDWP